MKTKVTFRHVKTQHELQEAALEAAERFEKFYNGITSTDIIFKNEADKTVEFTVRVHGNTLIAKESSDEFHKSLYEASDKMIRQLQKRKEKLFQNV
ncbi:MAG: ribosome-associated translation inhibitor RaiA [Ignavibacteriae bacterium]|nr:ribosome-associated translation inhibitor RaiA [Ignavibacteriota bacterium]